MAGCLAAWATQRGRRLRAGRIRLQINRSAERFRPRGRQQCADRIGTRSTEEAAASATGTSRQQTDAECPRHELRCSHFPSQSTLTLQGYFTFRTCCFANSLSTASPFDFLLLLIRGSRGTPPTDLAILPTSSGRCQTPFASLLPAAPYSQCHQLASRIWLEIVPSADRGSGCHVDQSRDARHRRGD